MPRKKGPEKWRLKPVQIAMSSEMIAIIDAEMPYVVEETMGAANHRAEVVRWLLAETLKGRIAARAANGNAS